MISPIFDTNAWTQLEGFNFQDITYHRAKDQGTVRIAFNRPECRNAFRPQTVDELYQALDHARMATDIGSVIITEVDVTKKMEDGHFVLEGSKNQRERWLQVSRWSTKSFSRKASYFGGSALN